METPDHVPANAICLECGTAKERAFDALCINGHDDWLEIGDDDARFRLGMRRFYVRKKSIQEAIIYNESLPRIDNHPYLEKLRELKVLGLFKKRTWENRKNSYPSYPSNKESLKCLVINTDGASFDSFVSCAFVWSETSEGHSFWSKIADTK